MSKGRKLKRYQSMERRIAPARVSSARDPERKFRKLMLSMAKDSLLKAVEWCEKDEWGWAYAMTKRAEKLLDAVKAL